MPDTYEQELAKHAETLGSEIYDIYCDMLTGVTDNEISSSSLEFLSGLRAQYGRDLFVAAFLLLLDDEDEMRRVMNLTPEELESEFRAHGEDPAEALRRKATKTRVMFLLGIKDGIEVIKNT